MSSPYIDADTLEQCHQAIRDGRTLDDLAGRLHVDTEYLGRLLQMPALKPIPTTDEPDLWSTDRLDGVL